MSEKPTIQSVKRHSQGARFLHLPRIAWLLLVLLLFLGGSWLGGGVTSAFSMIATRKMESFDRESAYWWLDLSDAISFPNSNTFLLRARLARQSGQYELMHRCLRRSRQLGADSKSIEFEELMARAQVGDLDAIESEINTLLTDSRIDRSELTNAYANGLAMQGRVEELMVLLDAWEKDFPIDPRPNHRRGLVFEFRQKNSSAAEQYRASLQKNRDHFPSLFALARTQQMDRQFREAIDTYQACRRAKNPIAAEVAIAACLREIGEMDDARAILERIGDPIPEVLTASYRDFESSSIGNEWTRELGAIEADAGNFQRAKQLLESALRIDPRDLEAKYAYAIALRGLGEQSKAEENFEQVQKARQALATSPPLLDRVSKNPNDLDARLRLGKVHLEWESARKGIYWLQSVLALDPNHQEAHRILADYYEGQSNSHPEMAIMAQKHRQRLMEAKPLP